MNASAIYSKSGKGVQEASGKTNVLQRSDRAVLAAIDGRATLADVAQKVGKPFDPAFEKLIESLDKGGFIREVSAGAPGVAGVTTKVPAALAAAAARAVPDPEAFEPHREAPLEHLGIGQPGVRHVRLHHVGAVEVRAGAGAPCDGLIVLVALVAEGEVVHGALRRR